MTALRGLLILSLAFGLTLPAQARAADRLLYADCAVDPDPPVCLARIAASRKTQDGDHLLEGIVGAGAVGLVEPNADVLIPAVGDMVGGPGKFLAQMGVDMGPDAATDAVKGAEGRTLLAAIALIAAARVEAHPFDDPDARRLAERSGKSRSELAQLGLLMWWSVNAGGNLLGDPLEPRGLDDLYDAVLADPGSDNERLLQVANDAYAPFQDKALALLSMVASRADLTPDARAGAASSLARRGDWRIAQRLLDEGGRNAQHYDIPSIQLEIDLARLNEGFDAEAVRRVVDSQESVEWGGLDNDIIEPRLLMALEKAGAKDALRQLGALYLAKARGGPENGDARSVSFFYGLASEAFRRGGDLDQALAAAREGSASYRLVLEQNPILVRDIRDPARQAAALNRWGSEPIIALYRAGQTEEALKIGYLQGYDRYSLEVEAGRPGDVAWVADSRNFTMIEFLTLNLEDRPDPVAARRLLDALEAAPDFRKATSEFDWEPQLALIAALAGDTGRMQSHLAAAAATLDRQKRGGENAGDYFALELAREWRKALLLAALSSGAHP